MFNRLVAFGCSHTYGHGLSDCYKHSNQFLEDYRHPGDSVSQHAWPSQLAKIMKIASVDNNGCPGASNKEIWKRIIDFKFKKDDIVFINWTHIERFCFFKDTADDTGSCWNETNAIHLGSDSKLAKWYFKNAYSDTDGLIDLFLRIDHARRYLDDIKVKHFHTFFNLPAIDEEYVPRALNGDYYKKILNFKVLPADFAAIAEQHPRALDNRHPGPLAHVRFAEEIYKLIHSVINN